MFTNRRVKKRDLLSIANYRLLQKGKKMIKSATTPWNRSRPRNMRSRQAKLHIGKGYSVKRNHRKQKIVITRTRTTSEATARMSSNSCPLTILTGRSVLSNRWMTKPTSDQGHLVFSSIHSFCIYNYFNEDVLATGNL